MVKIWDKKGEFYWWNENDPDEPHLVFPDTIAARNMMYTEGYTYEYMENEVEFHRYDPIIDDKTGYDLQ
jgi:hypothetical protein